MNAAMKMVPCNNCHGCGEVRTWNLSPENDCDTEECPACHGERGTPANDDASLEPLAEACGHCGTVRDVEDLCDACRALYELAGGHVPACACRACVLFAAVEASVAGRDDVDVDQYDEGDDERGYNPYTGGYDEDC